MNHYETLGITPQATPEEIKAAYRAKISKAHPDREGGSNEVAAQITSAYEVLSDPERRARYDSTGSDRAGPDPKAEAAQNVMQMVDQYLGADREFDGDIVADLKAGVMAGLAHINQGIAMSAQRRVRLERRMKRLRGPLVQALAEGRIQRELSLTANLKHQLEVFRHVIAMLDDYKDLEPQQSPFIWTRAGNGNSAVTSTGL